MQTGVLVQCRTGQCLAVTKSSLCESCKSNKIGAALIPKGARPRSHSPSQPRKPPRSGPHFYNELWLLVNPKRFAGANFFELLRVGHMSPTMTRYDPTPLGDHHDHYSRTHFTDRCPRCWHLDPDYAKGVELHRCYLPYRDWNYGAKWYLSFHSLIGAMSAPYISRYLIEGFEEQRVRT